MSNRRRLARLLRSKLRSAGRQYEQARREYEAGRASTWDLPTNADGEARIVCRRYAEKRAVSVDRKGRPACYDADHPDCEGCVADIRDGAVETWD
ncbi:DUF7091 family protein [Halosegnis marinus]|uniref:Uncharacterized protein n=1 Tax=Halosegnis marinus TaxID=3034023 RepID=A0ABD5ZP65_9EURY|nr:hypothetical protein [Halosegnis sp. DT85]